jgi:hypothetical protein
MTGKSSTAIKSHLWQATRKGLLELSPGRAGGQTTDKARPILGALIPWSEDLVPPPDAITVETELPRVDEDKPKRRRPQKAITSSTET